jgi:uncharacterized protein
VLQYYWLIPIGFAVGAYGTLIGAGGGFVLMPILVILFPRESPAVLASISLAVVFFNALSGSIAYARMKRVDYRAGLLFALATVPGAIAGALMTSLVSRRVFDLILGVLMICGGTFLAIFPRGVHREARGAVGQGLVRHVVTDAEGVEHEFSFSPALGMVLSVFVGFISSFLGIGGGIIHVPVLANVLFFPVHIATATSHFVLVIMALVGTIVHIVEGTFSRGVRRTVALAIGVLAGAQLGALLSKRLKGVWIIRSLALALVAAGIRVIV